MQSLFLAVIAEAREPRYPPDRGVRLPLRGGTALVRAVSRAPNRVSRPTSSRDFGFYTARADGRVELARLELGGLVPAEASVLERAKQKAAELLAPEPVPNRF